MTNLEIATPSLCLVDDDVYTVESRTRPGVRHTVDVAAGTCTCEAGAHGLACWHLDYVRAIHYWQRYEARARGVRPRSPRDATPPVAPATASPSQAR